MKVGVGSVAMILSPLSHTRQAGARDIVTALQHFYDGRTGTVDDVLEHRTKIERVGMTPPLHLRS